VSCDQSATLDVLLEDDPVRPSEPVGSMPAGLVRGPGGPFVDPLDPLHPLDHSPMVGVDRLLPSTRGLLVAFVAFTLLAVNQLLLLGGATDRFFAWTITSRPNATFLGAAYAAGCLLSLLALRRRRWSQVRIAVVTVAAFTVLTLIPTLEHRHRFNMMEEGLVARSAAWVWLVVYIAAPVACCVVVVRQERRRPRRERVADPMPRWLMAVLLLQGAALATAGALLWAGGAGVHVTVQVMRAPWPWPVTPLTSQVLGAWLLSFGVAVGLAARERDLSRMFVPAVAYAAFGLVELVTLLVFRSAPGTDTPWLAVDVALLATLVPAGAYGAWRAARAGGAD
jgi:hypothetical protein